MTSGIGGANDTSALRRPLPIADGFAYAARTGLLGLCIITESSLGSSPSRIDAMAAANPATAWRHRARLWFIQSP